MDATHSANRLRWNTPEGDGRAYGGRRDDHRGGQVPPRRTVRVVARGVLERQKGCGAAPRHLQQTRVPAAGRGGQAKDRLSLGPAVGGRVFFGNRFRTTRRPQRTRVGGGQRGTVEPSYGMGPSAWDYEGAGKPGFALPFPFPPRSRDCSDRIRPPPLGERRSPLQFGSAESPQPWAASPKPVTRPGRANPLAPT